MGTVHGTPSTREGHKIDVLFGVNGSWIQGHFDWGFSCCCRTIF